MKLLPFILFPVLFSSCSVLVGRVRPIEEKSASSSSEESILNRHGWRTLAFSSAAGGGEAPDAPDAAWQSSKTPAVISLNSVCRKTKGRQRDLKQITQILLSQWDNLKIEKEQALTVSGLPAYETVGLGEYLTSRRKFETLVVKSPTCIYDLIYLSPEETFDQEISVFHEFRDSLTLK